jgi:hypothetical protein
MSASTTSDYQIDYGVPGALGAGRTARLFDRMPVGPVKWGVIKRVSTMLLGDRIGHAERMKLIIPLVGQIIILPGDGSVAGSGPGGVVVVPPGQEATLRPHDESTFAELDIPDAWPTRLRVIDNEEFRKYKLGNPETGSANIELDLPTSQMGINYIALHLLSPAASHQTPAGDNVNGAMLFNLRGTFSSDRAAKVAGLGRIWVPPGQSYTINGRSDQHIPGLTSVLEVLF